MPFPFAPDQYQSQLAAKAATLTELLADWARPDLTVCASQPSHYRMRAEFRIWHDGPRSYYAMFDPKDPTQPLEVTEFPVASKLLNRLMDEVMAAVMSDPELRHKLFQVNFLTTQSGDALITLIYHRQLAEDWLERGHHWQAIWGVPVIGRARKQRHVLSRDFVIEQLTIAGQPYDFHQYESSFTQPNAGVCEQMVSWAVAQTMDSQQGDLMEMYCGNGNFSIPLSRNFRLALGTEISRTAVKSAQENISLNRRDNLKIARMASEDLSKAWVKNEPSRRFNEFDMASYDFDTVLVDPPRAGLDEDTISLIQRFRRIVYVSCNPESMVANIAALQGDYRMTACALFDQFPYTHHMEAGVILERNE
ncbi:tRNA (uridine(54)-C5)-methyltransferase TrmA [Reinekea sp.]|uniref:tRNA (uridine(54)-C5)-methyltransferase TrmA n=1 Tax=Reinekea sp. TaxID=1970455 RepID=UPI002A8119E9|nr:tRNA (uridine(54)-C5)-methyltransferase TrmA [Reinekea sp.]